MQTELNGIFIQYGIKLDYLKWNKLKLNIDKKEIIFLEIDKNEKTLKNII
jgi:hypothetical protein